MKFVYLTFDDEGPKDISIIDASSIKEAIVYIIENKNFFDPCPEEIGMDEYVSEIENYIFSDTNYFDGDSKSMIVLVEKEVELANSAYSLAPRCTCGAGFDDYDYPHIVGCPVRPVNGAMIQKLEYVLDALSANIENQHAHGNQPNVCPACGSTNTVIRPLFDCLDCGKRSAFGETA